MEKVRSVTSLIHPQPSHRLRLQSRHIIEINNLHVWQLSSERLVASVRIRFDDTVSWEKMLSLVNQVENCFYEEGVHVVTVHPEVMTVDNSDGHSVSSRHHSLILALAKSTLSSLQMIVDASPYDTERGRCDTCCRVDMDGDSGITGVLVTSDGRLRVSIHGQPTRTNEDVTVWM